MMGRKVIELYGSNASWEDINGLARRAIEQNWFPEAAEKGVLAYVKARLRGMARKRNSETGLPELASIEVPFGEEGEIKRVYKQLSMFAPEDYEQVCKYHSQQVDHHISLVKAYAEDCYRRYGVAPTILTEQVSMVFTEPPKPSIPDIKEKREMYEEYLADISEDQTQKPTGTE